MKIFLAFIMICMLSSCKTENEPQSTVILYGNRDAYNFINAVLKIKNTDYKCLSFEQNNSNTITFICNKVQNEKDNSNTNSTTISK